MAGASLLSTAPCAAASAPGFRCTRRGFSSRCLFQQSFNSHPFPRGLSIVRAAAEPSGSPSTTTDEKWLKLLPDKKAALYSHSLHCIEAWLRNLGFSQTKDDRASWTIQRTDWHAVLSLDITELRIRYLKSGPGNLDRDVERKFSYAFCREDLENAILGGP